MTLAKTESPDLIVVCVEAQPTNGYMLCTRLKKDEQLKSIPVILTSANATPDSFEKHKKLKTRAEDYLIKPFAPSTMLEKAASLMGVQLPDEQHEEIVTSIEDEPLGLGDLVQGEDEPISLSEADVQEARNGQPEEALVVEEVEEVEVHEEAAAGEDDLEMFDRAFDSLGGPAVTPPEEGTKRFADAPAPAAARREEPRAPAPEPPPAPAEELLVPAQPDEAVVLSGVDDEVGSQLEARVAELEQALAEREAELGQARKGEGSSGAILKLKEAKNRADKEVLRLKEELTAKEKELVELQEQQTALESQVQQLQDEAVKREASAKALEKRADALAAAAKKFERELGAARDEAKRGNAAELEKLRAELESVRTDLAAATGEKDLLGEERDELKKQLEEAQLTAVQNEDRAVKAYQKIKGDEKLRQKTRKALEIALQLLQEDAVDSEEADEPEKHTA